MYVYVFQLPFKVDIIKDPRELDGKSTAVHAAILAPHDVTVYQFPVIPDYTDLTKVIYCCTLVLDILCTSVIFVTNSFFILLLTEFTSNNFSFLSSSCSSKQHSF